MESSTSVIAMVVLGRLRLVLDLRAVGALVVEVALEAQRPDREAGRDEEQQHAGDDPVPGWRFARGC
jgi:hypothetical protein